MSNLAIIPARGGSKRIPRKNIKTFIDKPIIAYSIRAAIESNLFDEVMVSTDDAEIASVAKSYGAEVPYFRSQKNADDFATLMDVVLEVVAWYEANGFVPDAVCCILPTAPFITPEKLKDGFEKLSGHNFTSVFPVVKFSYPIQRALEVDPESDTVTMALPENLTARSQDLKDYYHDSGQFYWAVTEVIREEKTFFTNQAGMIEMSQIAVQDIDSEEDWIVAEQKYQALKKLTT